MKFFVVPVLFVLLVTGVSAQFPRMIVQLRDKGNNSFTLADPSRYLSGKAIERRSRFHIALDSLDLPVSGRYVDSIKAAGNLSVISTSKWLNQVLVESTDSITIS